MKKLYLIRHAKSSWEDTGLYDHERPLLPKGVKRTKRVIKYLIENNINIDLIISSYAVRAHETVKLIARALNYPIDNINLDNQLYEAGVQGYFNQFKVLTDNINSVMLAGHNPTITDFANHFLEKKIDWLPTSGIICISFKTDKWEKALDSGKIINFVIYPSILKK